MVKTAPKPNYLVADCKLYHKDNAEFLSQLTFITLIPSTIKLEKILISEALAVQQWTTIDNNYQYRVNEVEHLDIKQRWIVVNSKAASAQVEQKDEAIQYAIEQKSCFILATNADKKALTPEEILHHYKAQSAVERGFRFLKDPLFFVSSLFIKKPSRIDALLMIMTLSLLVYSIAQRRMRASMEKANETIPNQINIPTATPTLRWVFQCFEGINFVQTEKTYDKTNIYLDGFDELRTKD
jgi:transposase